MAYNAAQLQQILRQAGWPESLLVTMAAIALAESGGNERAHNPNPPDDSYGLWQINMLGSLGPARRAALGISSNTALYDPITNARAALMVYQAQGFRAWSVYLNGSYRKFLPQSQAAYSQTVAPAPVAQDVVAAQGVNLNPVIPFPGIFNFDTVVNSASPGAVAGISASVLLLIGAGLLTVYLVTD